MALWTPQGLSSVFSASPPIQLPEVLLAASTIRSVVAAHEPGVPVEVVVVVLPPAPGVVVVVVVLPPAPGVVVVVLPPAPGVTVVPEPPVAYGGGVAVVLSSHAARVTRTDALRVKTPRP